MQVKVGMDGARVAFSIGAAFTLAFIVSGFSKYIGNAFLLGLICGPSVIMAVHEINKGLVFTMLVAYYWLWTYLLFVSLPLKRFYLLALQIILGLLVGILTGWYLSMIVDI